MPKRSPTISRTRICMAYRLRPSSPSGWKAVTLCHTQNRAVAVALMAIGTVATAFSPASSAAAAALAVSPPASSNAATERADVLLSQMTLSEELSLVGGGTVGIPRLGIPPLAFTDGPNGVGEGAKYVTSFPNAVNIGASFDPSLARGYGEALGAEAAASGKDLIAAPTINVVRSPLWGRAAETLGEDPYLTSQLVVPEIQGIQSQRVMAEVKHYAAYNQEIGRFGPSLGSPGVDVEVSDRALHEIYYPGFRAAVSTGGAASVMCSYNQINGTPSCESAKNLDELRTFGLQGFVEPDATLAVRNVIAAAKAGVNNFQLGSIASATGGAGAETNILTQAVGDGSLPRSVIDNSARDILIAMDHVGLLDHPALTTQSSPSASTDRTLAAKISTEATVLLKNSGDVLPLSRRTTSIAVIGADAGTGTQFEEGGSPGVVPGQAVITPLNGIRSRAPSGTSVTYVAGTEGVVALPVVPSNVLTPASGGGQGLTGNYFAGTAFSGPPVQTKNAATIDFASSAAPLQSIPGTSASSARWTGTLTPPKTGEYLFSIATAGQATLTIGGRQIISTSTEFSPTIVGEAGAQPVVAQGSIQLGADHPVTIAVEYSTAVSIEGAALHLGWEPPNPVAIQQAARAARAAQVAIVFANDRTSEGTDRSSLALPGDQDRLIEAVAKANRHTIVVLHTAGPVLMPWHNDVAAILEAWYPGQMSGTAIAQTLYGDADPSGRLPVTWPATEQQGPTATAAAFPGTDNKVSYSEGLLVGYRYYDQKGQKPLYPFGYGLSYTAFALGKPTIESGGSDAVSISVPVSNAGSRSGAQIVQVYVGDPVSASEPPRQLKAFARVELKSGQTIAVKLQLERSSFEIWDSTRNSWVVPNGKYQIYVGTSSSVLPYKRSVRISS